MITKNEKILEEKRKEIIDSILKLEEEYYKEYIQSIELNINLYDKILFIEDKIKKLEKELEKYDDENYNKNTRKKVPLSKKYIISLDYKYKLNSYKLFILLRMEFNSKKKLSILNKLRVIYINLIDSIDKDDYQVKRNVKYILSYIVEEIKKEKSKSQNKRLDEVKIKKFPKTVYKFRVKNNTLDDNPDNYILKTNVYDLIKNGYDVSEFDLLIIINSLKYIIKKDKINESLIKYIDDIITRICYNKEYENQSQEIYSLIDLVKFRKQKFPKNSNERKILNKIYKKLCSCKNLINSYNDFNNNNQKEYLYDIIVTLLYDETGYLPIKKLLEQYDCAANSMSGSKYILEYILELYLKNYEKMLTNNKNDYIKTSYIKEVYYLFINNPNINLSEDLIIKLNKQIDIFIKRITTDKMQKEITIYNNVFNMIHVKNEKRKNNIILDIDNLRVQSKTKELSYDTKEVDHNSLDNQIENLYIPNNHIDFIDLTDEENILLKNDYISYNYKHNDSSTILRISIPDISSIISEDSQINNYMYNQMLKGERLDKNLLDKLKFKEDCECHAITFKILLDKDNKPIDLYIYKSKVKVKKALKDDKIYAELKNLLKIFMDDKEYKLDEVIEEEVKKIINKLYLSFAKKYNIPFIYSGEEKVRRIKTSVYSNIMPILSRITKNEANQIYEIMNKNLGEFHYSNKPFNVEDDYDLNLIGEPNYIFLENQRIIKSLIINGLSKGKEIYDNKMDVFKERLNNIIEDLNSSVNYNDIYDSNLIIKTKNLIPNE